MFVESALRVSLLFVGEGLMRMLMPHRANAGATDGTCQYLLAGADCVANRIIQAEDLECQASV